jgi:uncharacterized protein (TIGR03790 family)
MKHFRLLVAFVLLLLALPAVSRGQTESYDDVMLIVNDASPASVEVGAYFATRRNIPAWHIYHMSVSTSESMDSATFIPLKWQLQGWMKSHNLVDSINYIVTTKGCPLRVTASWDDNANGIFGGQSSFEDCLALINGRDSIAILATKSSSTFAGSRYFGSTKHFKRDAKTLPMYLVTRLDAYTVDQIKAYIQKAESPTVLGDGAWVLDLDPGRDNPNGGYKGANDWLRTASATLISRGMSVTFDTTDTYLHGQQNVIGYASWGSNDGHSGGGEGAKPGNTWLNGSIAETYVSTGGRSFMPGTGYGQSLVADWIAEGASAVKGYTDEPYLFSMAHPDILFDRYTTGFNMAESYYAASQVLAWRQVVIGDPKMKLARLMNAVASASLGQGSRHAPLRDTLWIYNNSSVPLTVSQPLFAGADAADFSVVALNGKSFAQDISPKDSLGLIVTLMPGRLGAEQGVLQVPHKRATDQQNYIISIDLTGTGTPPVLASPDTAVIATTAGTPVVGTVTLRNMTLTDTLTVSSLLLTGAAKGQFKIDPSVTLPHQIPGGTSWDVKVEYTPSATGDDRAWLAVLSDGAPSNRNVRLHGTTSAVGGVTTLAPVPGIESSITAIAPNPFRSETVIGYHIAAEGSHVRVEIVNSLGTTVATLVDRIQRPGEQRATFDASGLPSGTYLCRLTVTDAAGVATTSVRSLSYSK